jgi:DNA-binding MarR family transcriptional regulator
MATLSATDPAKLSSPELAAWRGFLRAHAALVKHLDAELDAAHGLPLSSYEVLITLAEAPEHKLRMADLADRTLLSRSGMTRLVDRLQREGLLERTRCECDARGAFAELTAKGLETLARVRPAHLAGVRERFVSKLSEDEMRMLSEIWERLQPGAAQT